MKARNVVASPDRRLNSSTSSGGLTSLEHVFVPLQIASLHRLLVVHFDELPWRIPDVECTHKLTVHASPSPVMPETSQTL